MLPALAALFVFSPLTTDAKPVTLTHTFTANEKLSYAVEGALTAEQREGSLETWIPEDFNYSYSFTTEVQAMKADGFAQILYSRPTITEVQGETFTSPPKTKVEKIGQKALLTMSPINEIVSVKELSKPKPEKAKPAHDGGDDDSRRLDPLLAGRRQGDPLGPFIGEIQRLALFIGSMDSSLDFSPKLPLDEVKVGDTWKKTVSYEPQTLKGTKDKQAVQRLDYTYTYKGLMTSEGRKVNRVEATLDLNTDLATFFNQLAEASAEETGLKKLPMTLKATIDFDLDPKTGRTLLARAHSEGGYQLFLNDNPDTAIVEQRLKGNTTMRLTGVGVVKKG